MRFTESFIEEREWINVSHRGYPYLVRIHFTHLFNLSLWRRVCMYIFLGGGVR